MLSLSLLQNLSMLMTLSLLNGLLMRWFRKDSLPLGAAMGVLSGFVCVAGMMTPVVLKSGVFFDGRSIVLGITGLFGGPLAAGLSALMAAAYRLHVGGPGTPMGVAVIGASALLGCGAWVLRRRGRGISRPGPLLGLGFLIHTVMVALMVLLPAGDTAPTFRRVGWPILILYPLVFTVIGLAFVEIERHFMTEGALRQSLERFRQVAEASDAIIWELNPQGIYTYVSQASSRILGYHPEEMVGRLAYHDLFLPEERDALRNQVQAAMARQESFRDFPNQVRHRDGRVLEMETTGFPILDDEGRFQGYRGIDQDVTEHKQAEANRIQLEQERNHLQRLESVGRLAGGVAHDMNNVLGAIMAVGSVMKQRLSEDPGMAKHVNLLLDAAARGRDLVKGLTQFARKELKATEQLDLNELVRNEAELLRRTTLMKVEIELDLEPRLRPVMAEASALSNVLMNLCVNACDAMPEGGVLLLATRNLEGDQVEVCVADSGLGMPPDVVTRAMEPFFTTKPAGRGTGLGLSIVYGAIKAHGGTVEIQSELGRGTRVFLRLPAGFTDPAPVEEAEGAVGVVPPMRILLVDDDELIRATLPELLSQMGHAVILASSGLEALRRLEAGLPIDLVILDLNMPGMGGFEVLQRLRLIHPEMPVLMSSGFIPPGERDQLQTLPKVRVLAKPFRAEDIRRALLAMAAV